MVTKGILTDQRPPGLLDLMLDLSHSLGGYLTLQFDLLKSLGTYCSFPAFRLVS
jgi:hypothetical protein